MDVRTMQRRSKAGFTLAELLIVVAIMAVLTAVAIPVFGNQLEKSRESADLTSIDNAYSEIILALSDGSLAAEGSSITLSHGGTAKINKRTAATQGAAGSMVIVATKVPITQTVNGWTGVEHTVAGVNVPAFSGTSNTSNDNASAAVSTCPAVEGKNNPKTATIVFYFEQARLSNGGNGGQITLKTIGAQNMSSASAAGGT